MRRGEPWTLRRDERLDLDEQRPAALERRRDGDARRAERVRFEERGAGIGDLAQAVAGHLEHADLLGRAEAVLAERSRRRPEKRSPSSVSTTSTRCSSVLGPASVPSLVTWPTRITGTRVLLGIRLQARGGRAHLADRARPGPRARRW